MKYKTFYVDQIDSTNRELWRMLDAGKDVAEGFALWAGNQTAGRGLGDNSWSSEPNKNLTFSVLLKPQSIPPNKQFLLNKAIAIAIITALSETCNNIEFQIKWPNDIYCVNKKIAGTLIENRIMGNSYELCVAGIGININQVEFHKNLPNAASLALLTGREFDIKNLLNRVLEHILNYYSLLKNKNISKINEEYLQYLLGYSKWMQFAQNNKTFYAMIQGVNDHGKLIVKKKSGAIIECAMKEVEFLL